MSLLILTPDRNVRRHDYTGAFKPASATLMRVVGERGESAMVRRVDVSQSEPRRFRAIMAALEEFQRQFPEGVFGVAFICHGFSRKLQLGLSAKNARTFARALRAEPERVTLYACSAGGPTKSSGDGSLGDVLRDEIALAHGTNQGGIAELGGVVVDAHTTAGHATQNPYVRRFARQGSPVGGTGGQWIVAPDSKLWTRWRRALRGEKVSGVLPDLAYRFPRMSLAQIHDELAVALAARARNV